jgi:hypothetical protein
MQFHYAIDQIIEIYTDEFDDPSLKESIKLKDLLNNLELSYMHQKTVLSFLEMTQTPVEVNDSIKFKHHESGKKMKIDNIMMSQ